MTRVPVGFWNGHFPAGGSAVPPGLGRMRRRPPRLKPWAIVGCPSGTGTEIKRASRTFHVHAPESSLVRLRLRAGERVRTRSGLAMAVANGTLPRRDRAD